MCGREELGSLTRGFGPWVTATAPLLKVAVDRAQEEKARVFPVPKAGEPKAGTAQLGLLNPARTLREGGRGTP